MRCEIQECGKYQCCRIFIENTLAVEITTSAVKTQAAIFKINFGVTLIKYYANNNHWI